KLGLSAALVVIFITCPLYRACSPVRGACDLDDLREGGGGRGPARRPAASGRPAPPSTASTTAARRARPRAAAAKSASPRAPCALSRACSPVRGGCGLDDLREGGG